MNKETKEILGCLLQYQDSFWQKTIQYVCSWLIDQGFEINYKGE